MRTRVGAAVISIAVALGGASSSFGAISFAPAPGSPYAATDPAFVPMGGGILGGAAVGDFNGDGIADVAVEVESGVPELHSSGESISVLLGTRAGGLVPAPGSPVPIYTGGGVSEPAPVATGDFNGDGNTDLAVVDAIHNTVEILLGNGDGEFRLGGAPVSIAGSGSASKIAVGDFNGDGNLDVAVVSGDLNILLGNGSGGLTPAPGSPHPLPEWAWSVAAGRFNADGRDDLAIGESTAHVSIYMTNASAEVTPTAQTPIATGGGENRVASADFNRDGNADLVAVSTDTETATILLGDGSGAFTNAVGSPVPVPGGSASAPGLPNSVAAGDFTCAGVADLAISNFNGSSDSVAVLQGDGNGGFTSPLGSQFPANGNPDSVLVGDFNGDGKPDIAVANPFLGRVSVLDNTSGPEPCPPPPEPRPGAAGGPGNRAASPGVIERLSLRRRTIRAGHAVTLRATLARAATLVVKFDRWLTLPGHARRHRLDLIGSVVLSGHAGANTFTITRVHGRWLARGTYTLAVSLRTGNGPVTVARVTLSVD